MNNQPSRELMKRIQQRLRRYKVALNLIDKHSSAAEGTAFVKEETRETEEVLDLVDWHMWCHEGESFEEFKKTIANDGGSL